MIYLSRFEISQHFRSNPKKGWMPPPIENTYLDGLHILLQKIILTVLLRVPSSGDVLANLTKPRCQSNKYQCTKS